MTDAQRTRAMRTLWITAICLATANLVDSTSVGWVTIDMATIILAAWWLTA